MATDDKLKRQERLEYHTHGVRQRTNGLTLTSSG